MNTHNNKKKLCKVCYYKFLPTDDSTICPVCMQVNEGAAKEEIDYVLGCLEEMNDSCRYLSNRLQFVECNPYNGVVNTQDVRDCLNNLVSCISLKIGELQ